MRFSKENTAKGHLSRLLKQISIKIGLLSLRLSLTTVVYYLCVYAKSKTLQGLRGDLEK